MGKLEKIKIEYVPKSINSYREISFVNDFVFWLDSINAEGSTRNAVFVKPFNKNSCLPQNLVGDSFSIKSVFHGYGGQSYKVFNLNEIIYLIWIDKITNALWFQTYQINKSHNTGDGNYLILNSFPKQITNSNEGNYDASFVLTDKKVLIGILERNHKDYLFKINLDESPANVVILKEFDGFIGSLAASSDNKIISWIEWEIPNMPWEKNELVFANINPDGDLIKNQLFAKELISQNCNFSFFQPFWLDKDILVCSEDSSGWWNLIFLEINGLNRISIRQRLKKESYEYGVPQWISGLSLFAGSKENFFCLSRNNNSWILDYYKKLVFEKEIQLPFSYLSDIHACEDKLILKASSKVSPAVLLEIDLNSTQGIPCAPELLNKKVSYNFYIAESFWFKGFQNKPTHAWLYKPNVEIPEKPPLIVKAHSGPTSCFSGTLNSDIQFWTSRGWFVAEVNYGGSSGYGKAYRERLNSNWGIVDAFDCNALANSLIALKIINQSKIFIFGNSAGGFTALNAISTSDIFKAAVCKYHVIDLNEMRQNTHRFEKHYLNSLIGEYDLNKDKYFLRSPMNNINTIKKPVLLFHGKRDEVISYKQSIQFHKKLLTNKTYSEIKIFENEGHGFKNKENKLQVTEITKNFLEKLL